MKTFRFLTPDALVERVEDVHVEWLQGWGVRGVILDLDNTIVPWHTTTLTARVRDWVMQLESAEIRVCLLTNNYSRHAVAVASELGVPIVRAAFKPLPTGFRRSLAHLGVEPSEGLVIGDQLFTDVLGAKLTGMRAIVVTPLSTREFPTTKLLRMFEAPVFARLRRVGAA